MKIVASINPVWRITLKVSQYRINNIIIKITQIRIMNKTIQPKFILKIQVSRNKKKSKELSMQNHQDKNNH